MVKKKEEKLRIPNLLTKIYSCDPSPLFPSRHIFVMFRISANGSGKQLISITETLIFQ